MSDQFIEAEVTGGIRTMETFGSSECEVYFVTAIWDIHRIELPLWKYGCLSGHGLVRWIRKTDAEVNPG